MRACVEVVFGPASHEGTGGAWSLTAAPCPGWFCSAFQVIGVMGGGTMREARGFSWWGPKASPSQPRAGPSRCTRNITADSPWPCICRRQSKAPSGLAGSTTRPSRGTCLTGRRGTSDCRGSKGARGAGAAELSKQTGVGWESLTSLRRVCAAHHQVSNHRLAREQAAAGDSCT